MAYGQTGSGKTHTMLGIIALSKYDLSVFLMHHASPSGTRITSFPEDMEAEAIENAVNAPGSEEGLMMLAVCELFRLMQADASRSVLEIKVSYFEVYKTKLRDLQSPDLNVCAVQNDQIIGLIETEVTRPSEIYQLIRAAQSKFLLFIISQIEHKGLSHTQYVVVSSM